MHQWTISARRIALAGMLCVASSASAQYAGKSAYPLGQGSAGPTAVDDQSFRLVLGFLSRFQYVKQPADEAYAAKVLQVYLRQLDPQRLFFSREDVADLEAQSSQLLASNELAMPKNIAARHAGLAMQRLERAIGLLEQGVDDAAAETLDVRESYDAPFLSSQELDERWRKIVKSDWLQLRSAGKQDDDIRRLLTQRYRQFGVHVSTTDSEDAVQRFISAYAMAGGLGSRYMSPRNLVTGLLPKLGLTVVADAGGPVVRHVMAVGSDTRHAIRQGDRIVALSVDQGDMIYLDGWQSHDLATLPEGTSVHVQLRRYGVGAGGPLREATLAPVKEVPQDVASFRMVRAGKPASSVAVIGLSTFYQDFRARQGGDANYQSAARDVEQLLIRARKEGAAGVIVDLRGNAGGSATEVADVAGLFLGDQPLWRNNTEKDGTQIVTTERKAVWTGPLAVIVNGASAEAPEFFAAAIQDHRQGLIVGKPSAGAGNTANLISLRRLGSAQGDLALTLGTVYRANGENITGHGVVPDIDLAMPIQHALRQGPPLVSFDSIEAMKVTQANDLSKALPALQRKEIERTASRTARTVPIDSDALLAAWPIDLNASTTYAEADDEAAQPDDSELLNHVAAIVIDAKRELHW